MKLTSPFTTEEAMPMKYKVPATWRVSGYYDIEANSEEEAASKVYHANYLPNQSEYVDDSLIVDTDDITVQDQNESGSNSEKLGRYRAKVFWSMTADVEVSAEDESDAYDMAADQVNECSLPKDGQYVVGSTDVINVELIADPK